MLPCIMAEKHVIALGPACPDPVLSKTLGRFRHLSHLFLEDSSLFSRLDARNSLPRTLQSLRLVRPKDFSDQRQTDYSCVPIICLSTVDVPVVTATGLQHILSTCSHLQTLLGCAAHRASPRSELRESYPHVAITNDDVANDSLEGSGLGADWSVWSLRALQALPSVAPAASPADGETPTDDDMQVDGSDSESADNGTDGEGTDSSADSSSESEPELASDHASSDGESDDSGSEDEDADGDAAAGLALHCATDIQMQPTDCVGHCMQFYCLCSVLLIVCLCSRSPICQIWHRFLAH